MSIVVSTMRASGGSAKSKTSVPTGTEVCTPRCHPGWMPLTQASHLDRYGTTYRGGSLEAIRYRAPDNGGASGAAYLHSAFGARLPDPFRPAVSTDLAPPAGSLNLVPDVLAPFVVVHRIVLSCPESSGVARLCQVTVGAGRGIADQRA